MTVGVHVDELGGLVGNELLELVVPQVDVFHAAVQNGVFRSLDAANVVLVEHSRNFIVKELLRKLGCRDVLGDECAVDACAGEVGELGDESA